MKHQAAMLTMGLQVMVQHYGTQSRSTKEYLQVIGHQHGERGIKKDDYTIFIDVLLVTLAEFHGPDWSEPLSDDWQAACADAIAVMLSGASQD